MRPLNQILTAWTVACVACVAMPEPADSATETGDTQSNSEVGETEGTGETETGTGETGDPQPRECDEGLELCCFGDAIDCEDQWNGEQTPDQQLWGCVDTTVSRYNCGGCNNGCPTDQLNAEDIVPVACTNSICDPTLGSSCVATSEGLTCDEVCAADDETCVAQGCNGNTMFIYPQGSFDCNSDVETPTSLGLACDEPPPAEYSDGEMRCCCE